MKRVGLLTASLSKWKQEGPRSDGVRNAEQQLPY